MHVTTAQPLWDTLSDEELAALARSGREEAFRVLAARCVPWIQTLLNRFGQHGHDADDLAQEGMLGLLSAVQNYRTDGGASFRTYAMVCIRHRISSALRRLSAKQEPVSQPLEELDEAGERNRTPEQDDPAHLIIQREDIVSLRTRLGKALSPLEYTVLMYHLASYSYEEMASRLHLSRKSIDNALQRARKKCVKLLS